MGNFHVCKLGTNYNTYDAMRTWSPILIINKLDIKIIALYETYRSILKRGFTSRWISNKTIWISNLMICRYEIKFFFLRIFYQLCIRSNSRISSCGQGQVVRICEIRNETEVINVKRIFRLLSEFCCFFAHFIFCILFSINYLFVFFRFCLI